MSEPQPPPHRRRPRPVDWARSWPGRHASRWDSRVEAWETVAASPAFLDLRDRVIGFADPQPSDRVLDLGAGTGLLTLALAPLTHSVHALDSSEPMLTRLSERARAAGCDNVVTTVADLRNIPLPDEQFTLIVSNYAFHHLKHAGKTLALSEARRVLAPGGRIVIADMMFEFSLSARDRRIILGKIGAIARRGPSGAVRLARNAARLAVGNWEHPESVVSWRQMLEQRRFAAVSVEPLEHEGGIATARRPPDPDTPS